MHTAHRALATTVVTWCLFVVSPSADAEIVQLTATGIVAAVATSGPPSAPTGPDLPIELQIGDAFAVTMNIDLSVPDLQNGANPNAAVYWGGIIAAQLTLGEYSTTNLTGPGYATFYNDAPAGAAGSGYTDAIFLTAQGQDGLLNRTLSLGGSVFAAAPPGVLHSTALDPIKLGLFDAQMRYQLFESGGVTTLDGVIEEVKVQPVPLPAGSWLFTSAATLLLALRKRPSLAGRRREGLQYFEATQLFFAASLSRIAPRRG